MAFVLMSKLMAMLLLVVVGYVTVKLHVLETRDSVVLSRLTVYILQPCLIFRSFQIEITPERMNGFLSALLLGFTVYIIWILILSVLKRPLKLDPVDQCTLIYSNVGNLALPLISMILGDEYVFYASALQVPFNLFIWTHGVSIISGEKHLHFRKIFLNPNIIALAAGLVFCAFQIRIPDVPDTAIKSLSDMVGPTTMLVIGMVIAGQDLRRAFTDKRAYLICIGRLLVMPVSVLLMIALGGIPARYGQLLPIFQVCFIALCTPSASTVSQLAVMYDQKAYEAGVYSVLTMAFCTLTMPFMLAVFQLLFAGNMG